MLRAVGLALAGISFLALFMSATVPVNANGMGGGGGGGNWGGGGGHGFGGGGGGGAFTGGLVGGILSSGAFGAAPVPPQGDLPPCAAWRAILAEDAAAGVAPARAAADRARYVDCMNGYGYGR